MPSKPFTLSAKVVILDKDGRCLLLRRSASSKAGAGKLDLPGGKVDAGEAFESALRREVREEAGLEVSLEQVLGAAQSDLPDRRVAYLILEASLASGEVCLSNEHTEYLWVERASLAKMDLCPQFKAFAAAYARGGRGYST